MKVGAQPSGAGRPERVLICVERIPNPGSEQATAKGCTCSPEKNNHGENPGNWWIIEPNCPIHAGVANMMAFMEQQEQDRKAKRRR